MNILNVFQHLMVYCNTYTAMPASLKIHYKVADNLHDISLNTVSLSKYKVL